MSLVLSRCAATAAGRRRWVIRLEHGHSPDITIAVRMDAANEGVHDFYVLPTIHMRFDKLRLHEDNGAFLDVFRQPDLTMFYEVLDRVALRIAG